MGGKLHQMCLPQYFKDLGCPTIPKVPVMNFKPADDEAQAWDVSLRVKPVSYDKYLEGFLTILRGNSVWNDLKVNRDPRSADDWSTIDEINRYFKKVDAWNGIMPCLGTRHLQLKERHPSGRTTSHNLADLRFLQKIDSLLCYCGKCVINPKNWK